VPEPVSGSRFSGSFCRSDRFIGFTGRSDPKQPLYEIRGFAPVGFLPGLLENGSLQVGWSLDFGEAPAESIPVEPIDNIIAESIVLVKHSLPPFRFIVGVSRALPEKTLLNHSASLA
jgi:hypothetical protein